ncbi:MAG: CPBP family intramembrane glutamic endopeptidase [Candidatus Brocadiales bacterium]
MSIPDIMSRDRVCPWNVGDAIKVFAFYFLMMSLGSAILLFGFHKLFGQDPSAVFGENMVMLTLVLITNTLSCLYLLYIVRVRRAQPLAALGVSLLDWRKNLTWGLLRYAVVLPVILASGFLVELMTKNAGITPEHQAVVQRFLEERSYFGVAAILAFGILIGPVTEELLFRGFLQPALRDVLGGVKAILFTSFLFALVHFNLYIFIQIFILGLLLGYLYEKTGTLAAPVAVHILHNSVSLCALLWIKQSEGLF